jgi:hypothetical protein
MFLTSLCRKFLIPLRGISGKPRVKGHEQSECPERGVKDIKKR